MGQYKYFLKIQEDKVKDQRKERESLLEDFKKLGLKNKRLEDELKGRKGNPRRESSSRRAPKESLKKPRSKQKNNGS